MSDQGYAGDKSVTETYADLKANADAVLIDVRTVAEWQFVGVPDLSDTGRDPLFINWQVYPQMEIFADFAGEAARQGIKAGQPIYLLCRSGVRSRSAAIALTEAGYGPCYNIADGFEGNKDSGGHRGKVGGWKANGLPWQQQ